MNFTKNIFHMLFVEYFLGQLSLTVLDSFSSSQIIKKKNQIRFFSHPSISLYNWQCLFFCKAYLFSIQLLTLAFPHQARLFQRLLTSRMQINNKAEIKK